MSMGVLLTELENSLGHVVKDKNALKALNHVLNRVICFNSGKFPLIIEYVGLSGSALRSEKVGDIDIVLGCSPREEYSKEWKMFKELVSKRFKELWYLIQSTSVLKKRVTITDVIKIHYEKIRELGFKDWWITEWFRWITVSDFKRALDNGLPILCLSEKDLVKRYIKYAWRGKRIEIHMEDDVPYIVIWRRTTGLVKPSEEDLKRFFTDEYNRLVDIALAITGRKQRALPLVYSIIWRAQRSSPLQLSVSNNYVLSQYIEISNKIYTKAKHILTEKLEKLTVLVENKPSKIGEYKLINERIRMTLKEILALSYIINVLSDRRSVDNIIFKVRRESTEEYVSELRKYIIRNGARQGFRKDILENLLTSLAEI